MQDKVPFKWKGNHHSYYGIWLAAFAIFNYFMGIDNGELSTLLPLWEALLAIGVLMVADDVIEHTITADTPLRLLYDKIIKPILISMKNKK